MTSHKKILIMCFTSPLKDMRFLREVEFLRTAFDVTVAGALPSMSDLPFEEISCRKETWIDKQMFRLGLFFGSFAPYCSRFTVSNDFLRKTKFDLVLCNDLLPLPLAFRIAKNTPVFWDAHEYYPEELAAETIGQRLSNRAALRLCGKMIPRLAGMSSVCPAICQRYQNEFQLKEQPLLIRNMPAYANLSPSPVEQGKIRMIHHGGINRDRKLELMIDTMELLDKRFSLDFMLMHNPDNDDYYHFLQDRAAHNPRIHFLEPVPNKELINATNHYDFGFYLLQANDYNTKKSLPNKLFEFVQARLGIAIGPSSEMADIVRKYDLGVIAPNYSPKAMADTLNKLTMKDISRFKNKADFAANELCAEKELPKLVNKIQKILTK